MSSQGWPHQKQYIDVKDRDGNWLVGYAFNKNENQLKVRYEGYSFRYDETFPLSTLSKNSRQGRIQPFRTYTRGYTGQKKTTPNRENLKITHQDIEEKLKKVQDFIVNMKIKTGHELSQFLRGQHYFYIDFLMTTAYTSSNDIAKVYLYFKKHQELTKLYIERLLEIGLENCFSKEVAMKNEEQLAQQEAFIDCSYQIFESMYNIAGVNERLAMFMKVNEKVIKTIANQYETHENYISNELLTSGTFEAIKTLIKKAFEVCTSKQNFKIPYLFLYSLFLLFLTIQKTLQLQKDPELDDILDMIFLIMSLSFHGLEGEDIKTPGIEKEIEGLLTMTKETFGKHNKKQPAFEWVEEMRIRLYTFMMKSNSLDRKLRAVSKFKEFFQDLLRIYKGIKMTKQKFTFLFLELKWPQLLFQHNEHIEIFRKAIEFTISLYIHNIINIEPLIFAWDQSINRQPAIVKLLQSQWIEVAERLQPRDSQIFIQTVINYFAVNRDTNETNDSLEFFIKLVHRLAVNYSQKQVHIDPFDDEEQQVQPEFLQFQKGVAEMKQTAYELILSSADRENIQKLIETYALIAHTQYHKNDCIKQLFDNLTDQVNYHMSLRILNQIYSNSDCQYFFVPQDYADILLNCIKVTPITIGQTVLLFQLLNNILDRNRDNQSYDYLTSINFSSFWDTFQQHSEEMRVVFYQWLINPNQQRDLYDDDSHSPINTHIDQQLRKYITLYILRPENFMDFENLTMKELEIILYFIIQSNVRAEKIMEKQFCDVRMAYLLKSVEIMKESFLWTIFQNVKNIEVIQNLNRHLIHFYFYYCPNVPYHLRKGRIDDFLTRIKNYLDQGYNKDNPLLVKHSLMLLKRVIELIKEQKPVDVQHAAKTTWIKIQFTYESKLYNHEVKYEDTIGIIKFKIANFLKLENIKLLNSRQEQLGFETNNIHIYWLTDKYFKVVEVPKEEETLTKFIYSFLNESIEEILFKLLQNQQTAYEVYEVLEELELKQEKQQIIHRISEILSKYSEQDESQSNFIHYYYLLQIKIYNKHLTDEKFMEECFSSPTFQRLLKKINQPIKNFIHINLLLNLTSLLAKICKAKMKFSFRLEISQKLFDLVCKIYRYIQQNKFQFSIKEYLVKITQNCIQIMQHVITLNGMLTFFFSHSQAEEMMRLIFFSSQFEDVKTQIIDRIKGYFECYQKQPIKNMDIENKIAEIFLNSYYDLISTSFLNKQLKNTRGKTQFFTFMSTVIKSISLETFQKFILNEQNHFYKKVIDFIEKVTQSKDLTELDVSNFMITGHINMLKTIISRRPYLKSMEIVHLILNKCLGISNNIEEPSLNHHYSTIKSSFQFIKEVLRKNTNEEFLRGLIQLFSQSQQITTWRVSNKWAVTNSPERKQKYSGLINPGCICYMNSLLQQLFMIQQFRNRIFALNTEPPQEMTEQKQEDHNKVNTQASILQSMKNLFLKLLFSDQNIISPVPFARTIKNSQKKPMIKINEQMDIDQFESILFDKLEKELQLLGSKNLIRELFGGVYSNQIISNECPHRSEREQSFISISLQVKRNIYESFKSFVKVDLLDGDNKYFCEACNKKVKAQKIQSIKKLPPFLILCLKRFEFNFEIEAKIKINDYCEFYQNLHLKEFTTQEINRNSMTDEENQTKEPLSPNDIFNYKLRGVVVHTGSADSGHYYSYIQNKQGNWFEFNDQQVFSFDIKKLSDEAFGSKGIHDDNRIRNAYLLIYERSSKSETPKQNQETVYNTQENKSLINKILKKNRQIQKFQLVFSQNYKQLIENMLINYENLYFISKHTTIEHQWYEFLLSYYFLILIRKEEFEEFLIFSKYIEKYIKRSAIMCSKYLRLFTSCNFFEEFFVYNPHKQRCRVISHHFCTALIRHIEATLSISLQENELFNYSLLAIKLMLTHYGQIYELSIAMRKIFEYLSVKHPGHLHYIIRKYSFQTVYVDLMFGLIQNQQKLEYAQLFAVNKRSIRPSFVVTLQNDKKHLSDETPENWIILSIIFKEINKITQNASQDDPIKKQLAYLTSVISQAPISKILNCIYQSHQQRGVLHVYLTFKALNQVNRLLEALEKGLKDYQSTKYRPLALLILVMINDPDQYNRHDDIITILENVYKHNEKYFLEIQLLNQWMIRFVVSNEEFKAKFQQRRSILESIIKWITHIPLPNFDLLKKHKLPNSEKLLNRLYGILVSMDIKDYEDNNMAMKKVYQQLLNLNYTIHVPMTRVQQPYTPEKEIRYFDSQILRWLRGWVVSNTFGYVTIKTVQVKGKTLNFWEDSQKIKSSINGLEFELEKEQTSEISYNNQGEMEEEDEEERF